MMVTQSFLPTKNAMEKMTVQQNTGGIKGVKQKTKVLTCVKAQVYFIVITLNYHIDMP